MARAGGPGGGGDPGNSGGGSGGGTGGNGRGGRAGGPGGGSDPGNAPDGGGRGGRAGGPGGGSDPGNAPDGGGRGGRAGGPGGGSDPGNAPDGSNTPGDPSTPGRRSQNAEGTTAASRARSAMDRHSREAADREGGLLGSFTNALSEGFDTAKDALGLGDEEGVSVADNVANIRALDRQTTEAEIAGMVLGDENASLVGAVNAETEASPVARAISAFASVVGGVPGVLAGQTAEAADAARKSSNTLNSLNNTGMTLDDSFGTSMGFQARGAAADGIVGTVAGGLLGPPAAKAGGKAGAMFAGAVADKAGEMASDTAMMGEMSPSPSIGSNTPGRASTGNAVNGTASGARGAMVGGIQTAAAPTAPGFEWSPINMGVYGNGLLRNNT